jgi:hypothetical protein
MRDEENKKAVGRRQRAREVLCAAFYFLPSAYSSFIPHPSSLIPHFDSSDAMRK